MKALSIVLATIGAASIALVGAAPAMAAGNAVDPGDSLYAVNCDPAYNDWQLLSVESTTAASTPIGNGDGSVSESYNACAGQPAYNPATGESFYIQWEYGDGTGNYLASVDVATGASTRIGEFYYWNIEFPSYPSVESMAIGADGSAFVIAEDDLWSVDLTTAELTYVGGSLCCTYAFANDPVTGNYYAIDDENEIFLVDTTDGSFTSLGDVVTPGTVYSLQFDKAGTFWVEVDEDTDGGAGLWSFTLATKATPVYSGSFIDDPFYTEAILIIPGQPVALASTGADLAAAPYLAGGAVLIALAGVTLLVIRRRHAA